jgi:Fe-S-cluster-containing dehydrogenase component/anaerobic selenocysteine-containing dehydrogenase
MSQPAIGRRFFLQVVGATSVAAGCSPAHAPDKLVPLLNPPENLVPGRPLFYRTVCRACPAGCGVTARSREGRVVKLEGNPDEPISQGALCARGQAQLQRLYAPDRLRGPLARTPVGLQPLAWADAIAKVGAALSAQKDPQGRIAGLRLVSRAEPGSAGAVQRAFTAAAGGQRLVYEPLDLAAVRAASAALYGAPELPVVDLSQARAVVSFGADFAATWLSPVELSRQFAAARAGAARPRLTWIGPRLPVGAGSCDLWLRVAPGDELALAVSLLRWLVDPANGVGGLAPEAAALGAALPRLALPAGCSAEQLAALGRELANRRPSALLGPGAEATGPEGVALAAVIAATNHLLGSSGRTVRTGLTDTEEAPAGAAALEALLEEARQGKVTALLLAHADLAALPGAAQALRNIPLVVSLGERDDASARLAHFLLPDHHALESFGDLTPRKGLLQLQQATLAPLWETRAAAQTLLDLAAAAALPGIAERDFRELWKGRWQAAAKALGAKVESAQEQRDVQARGTVSSAAAPAERTFSVEGFARAVAQAKAPNGALRLAPFATALGGADPAAPPWMREVPDALTGVSWSGWVELSREAAARLGARDGDLLSLKTAAGEAELPLFTNRLLHDAAVALPSEAPERLHLGRGGGAVQVAHTGRAFALAVTGRPSQEGRALIRGQAPDGRLLPEPENEQEERAGAEAEHEHPHDHPHALPHSMNEAHEHPDHRWAMAIDLDRCTGCQACQIACYAENNLPVVGPQHARDGRLMAWLRLQRAFEGEGADGRIPLLPSLCQQCDAAPCETVCPVYATYHNPEGLNAQVYNRCIGTRYCANNCPYDARVFNWMDHEWPAPLHLQLNPDVSARSKGVMEKCTFCVQRIRAGKNTAKSEGRPVRDGEIQPACVQTCPAQALTFGDAKDPGARVNAVRKDGRAYLLLEEANTMPAVTYLARKTGGRP